MGLSLGVGWPARDAAEADGDDVTAAQEPYEGLNSVLTANGLPRHDEPLHIPADEIFEAQMWGYGGLHSVRRMAAHLACQGKLPSPDKYENDAAKDPMVEQLIQMHLEHLDARQAKRKLFSFSRPKVPAMPPYQHLLWHSDSEGFYVPQDFEHVLIDEEGKYPELGGMVGSTPRLLEECLTLAQAISLPIDMDHEAEEFWNNAESAPATGEPWQMYGLEAFGLIRLIHGCQSSIRHKAVLLFA